VRITRVDSGAVIQDFVGTLASAEAASLENRSTLNENFTATTTGNYEVTLTDLNMPQPLAGGLIASVTKVGGNVLATLPAAGSATFAADAGTSYKVVAAGESATPLNGGLFSVRVRDTGSNAVVFSRTVTIGRVQRVGSAVLGAGPHALSLTDFQFPAALTQVGAAVTLDGQSVVTATTSGSTPFTATAGEHSFYGFGSTTSTGVFGIVVAPAAGPAVFTKLTSVNTTTPGATPAFSYAVDVATAGAYRVHLADFEFPGRVTGTQLAVAQAGAASLLGSLSAPGTLELPTVAAGRVFIFVLAQPTTSSGGLIGVDLVPAAGGDALFKRRRESVRCSTHARSAPPVPRAIESR